MILPDSDEGKRLGFTSENFSGWLWKIGNTIYISFIISKHQHKGNFKKLIDSILDSGYTVKIPTPLGRMQCIVRKSGYKRTYEYDELMRENVEVWVLTKKKC